MARVESLPDEQRVVVTGLGTVNPSGLNPKDSFRRWLAGESAITTTRIGYPGDYTIELAGKIRYFNPNRLISEKFLKRIPDVAIYALAASIQASRDAEILEVERPASRYKEPIYKLAEGIAGDRIMVIIGSAIGGADAASTTRHMMSKTHNPDKISVHTIAFLDSNEISAITARYIGATGGEYTPFNACATGALAGKLAYQEIITGQADIVLAGGAEASLVEVGYRGFHKMKALSPYINTPQDASRPFDTSGRGFVIGEGGGVLVYERLSHAIARGARIYAELIGFGLGSFAQEDIVPKASSEVVVMRRALAHAEIEPHQVDYINAHAGGTAAGDKPEAEAIKEVFGDHTLEMPVSSTKSMIGHLMGGAGGVETIATVLSVYRNRVHPTRSLRDPVLDGVFFPVERLNKVVNIAGVNSFGLNGTYFTAFYAKYPLNL